MKVIVAAFCVFVLPVEAFAQSFELQARAGVESLQYSYRFDNDSSFDTAFLVPHFFRQRYERSGPVYEFEARYRAFGRASETRLSLGPDRRGFGSDFDTFFQPGGDVVTSGTAGDVDLASIRIEHQVAVAAKAGVRFDVFLGWRRDRADFYPADRVVTHTLPPSESREWTTDRERTVSQTFEVGAAGTLRANAGRWRVEATGRLVPALRARLLVQLPDKYPGRDIVFTAAGWSGAGRVTATRDFGRISAGGWAGIEQAGSYRRSAEFDRTAASAGIAIAFAGRR